MQQRSINTQFKKLYNNKEKKNFLNSKIKYIARCKTWSLRDQKKNESLEVETLKFLRSNSAASFTRQQYKL